MKKFYLAIIIGLLAIPYFSYSQCAETFHDFSATDIRGSELNMSTFAGKKVLVVNTASLCGYTYQYGQLQQLYETYGGSNNPYNFEIIGFPSNDFANQEPGSEDDIIDVCDSYGVTFTMMSKIHVKGTSQHEIYAWLTKLDRNCVKNQSVSWNFNKFMVNPDGSWHGHKSQTVNPLTNPDIINWITATTSSEIKDSDRINIYTSDVDNNLYILIESIKPQFISARLFSITGQYISTLHEGNVKSNTEIIKSTSGIKTGIYFVEIVGENFKTNRRVIIK